MNCGNCGFPMGVTTPEHPQHLPAGQAPAETRRHLCMRCGQVETLQGQVTVQGRSIGKLRAGTPDTMSRR